MSRAITVGEEPRPRGGTTPGGPPHVLRRALVLAVFAVAAVLLAVTAVTAVSTAAFAARAERVSGQVVAVKSRPSGGSVTEVVSFAVVEFVPGPGQAPVRFQASGGIRREFRVGQQVPVLFERDDPRGARLKGPAAVWAVPAGLLLFGLLALGCGVMLRRVLLETQPGGPDPDD